MVSRHATCVDCGAQVVLTNAKPVVRGGKVCLQCAGCAGHEEDDDYASIVVSGSSDADSGQQDVAAGADGVYGGRHGSVSGAIEANTGPSRSDTAPPPVIINDEP